MLLTQTLNNYVQTKTITYTSTANAAVALGLDANYEVISVYGINTSNMRFIPIAITVKIHLRLFADTTKNRGIQTNDHSVGTSFCR